MEQNQAEKGKFQSEGKTLVLPLDTLDRSLLELVGGKAANLGELIQAGFAVPPGFCLTTTAYIVASAQLEPILLELAATRENETVQLTQLAAAARNTLLQTPIPTEVVEAVTQAYQALSKGEAVPVPVAVRSSATTEDLPSASFAGQHQTFLNVIGVEALLNAVQQCWASLWNERAVLYRQSLGIDPRSTRLAVVIQNMVEAHLAGVLFTANPLTGKRKQVVIDASGGLGEAVVSGATNPDHFVINPSTGEIIERHLGDKRVAVRSKAGGGTERIERPQPAPDEELTACLSDTQVQALTELGTKIEAHFGVPQDIEWALDQSQRCWILQTRPITTLFPLPQSEETLPGDEETLLVYLSFNVQQGTYRPFTPMGISALRLLASEITSLAGYPPPSPLAGPPFIKEAAGRVFLDVTGALRSSLGRNILSKVLAQAEAQAGPIFKELANDRRLSTRPTRKLPLLLTLRRLLFGTRLPLYLPLTLLSPNFAHTRFLKLLEQGQANRQPQPDATSPADYLLQVEQLLVKTTPKLVSRAAPVMLGSLATLQLASRLLGKLATESELQTVVRGAPFNPTTEMNLALWSLAQQIRTDKPATAKLVSATPPTQLAEEYHQGHLPPLLQAGIARFLASYGHRAVAELDLGLPRWSEDPTYVFSILNRYLQLKELASTPAEEFQGGALGAESMIKELTGRARRLGWWQGLVVSFCLRRARALGGLREMPRFALTALLAQARTLLTQVGEKLAQEGHLEKAQDIFFLTLPEAHTALAGTDMRRLVSLRRADYERELTRQHVPLVLLSDGTQPTLEVLIPGRAGSPAGVLQGTAASAGRSTGRARVIFDPSEAQLETGEILVAPSTDPGWTPLFLSASALVMETGGAMAHGAIVAREYGIPAVVGVPGATTRIVSGQQITVDGSTGTIFLLEQNQE